MRAGGGVGWRVVFDPFVCFFLSFPLPVDSLPSLTTRRLSCSLATGWVMHAGYEAACTDVGMGLLFVATFLTVQSVLGYFVGLWKFFVV